MSPSLGPRQARQRGQLVAIEFGIVQVVESRIPIMLLGGHCA